MAHDEQPARITVKGRDIVVRPAQRHGAVGEEIGEFDLGIKPVVRHDHDVAAAGERRGEKAVSGFVASLPAPAVEEDDDWGAGGTARLIDIELAARAVGIGNVDRGLVTDEPGDAA